MYRIISNKIKDKKYYAVGTNSKSNGKAKKYCTVGTILKSNRKTKNNTMSAQFQNPIEKKKYYTVSTILKSNRKIAEKVAKSTPLILIYITDHFNVWYRHFNTKNK